MVIQMKLIYPACFYPEDDGGFSVTVPDLKGCITQGDTLQEALQMAEDAALGWLLTSIEDGEELPKASNIKDVRLENTNGFTSLLLLDLGLYSQKYGNRKSVKKTVSIPLWLNEAAEKYNINFSKTLQDALFNTVILKKQHSKTIKK